MNVPNLSFLEKKQKSEYFLSLVLRDEKASAVVFEEINKKVNVVGEHNEFFNSSIENATEEELLEVIDKAVSTAERNLPPDVESKKTIFGVKQDWIENGKIKKDYLAKLKKVSNALGFEAMGFLLISEAISHLLQKEEGAPISAILAEIGKREITVSVIEGGKIIEVQTSSVEESEALTVERILKRFTKPSVLPTRIILLDGGKERLQQDFITHHWSKDLGFMHIPQVTNLPANFDARAVLNGAATEMGFEVLEDSLKKAIKQDAIPVDALSSAITPTDDKTLAEAASEFGFVNGDVKSETNKDESAEEKTEPETEVAKPKTAVDESIQSDNLNIADQFREIPEEVKLKTAGKRSLPINAALMMGGIMGFVRKIDIGKVLRGANNSRKKLLIGVIPLALILVILFVYFFARTATITLDVESKNVDKTENVIFSQSEATDASKNIIKVEFLTVSQDGKISTQTTGKKQTGEKAKGTVTVFNIGDSGITLPTGTTITSPNNLNFLTDKPVTIASGSADPTSPQAGKANVTVTAEKFGTNYNMPSASKFTLKDGGSKVAAKNDNAFSGGTIKDIKVVAKEDADKLAKNLQKQLESGARDEILKKGSGNSVVLPNFISVTFDRKSFSKDVGEEATEVSLTATISYKGVSYKKEEIVAYAKDKLKENDEKLTINEDSIQAEAENLEEDDKNATAKLKIKAGLIPIIDAGELANEIKGKSASSAIEKLNQIPQVNKVDLKIFPPLPLLPNLLPFSSGKIKILVNKNG